MNDPYAVAALAKLVLRRAVKFVRNLNSNLKVCRPKWQQNYAQRLE